ncbi:mitochondrial protein Pet127-domain-containing protein [Dichotomocladium elegans]|nr:mitochondrial protein Pet127-domain-containing protein [Dichotomocladium elegans]
MLRLQPQAIQSCLRHRGFRSTVIAFQDENEKSTEASEPEKTSLAVRLKRLDRDHQQDTNNINPSVANFEKPVVHSRNISAKDFRNPILPFKTSIHINPNQVYKPFEVPGQGELPTLAHGLDRVLFNPGVHHLKDPRTHVYNFTPFLEYLTQPIDFNYDMLAPYISPSKDKNLTELAKMRKKRYVGSTSSVSSALSQVYFTLTNFKPVNMLGLSMHFADEPAKFTRATRAPSSINLLYNDGVYSIDADKSNDIEDTILSIMGKSMEKVLTSPPEEYERYLKDSKSPMSAEEINQPETYAYGTIGKILLRSQLDCQDPRLPRKTFDLKTRAAIPVRLDIQNYQDYLGYTLRRPHGLLESFEREYYDMMRSAFLKYNFQVRIGNMDGILVAYHNTRKMFGFQYISREEMDARLYGNSWMGNLAFNKTLVLFQSVLDAATAKYPNQSLNLTFEANEDMGLSIFVEILNGNASLSKEDGHPPPTGHDDLCAGEQESIDPLLTPQNSETHGELSKFVLTVRSVVNDVPVDSGPVSVNRRESWKTSYNIIDASTPQKVLREQLNAAQKRQMQAFGFTRELSPKFANILRAMSKRGLLAERRHVEQAGNRMEDLEYLF